MAYFEFTDADYGHKSDVSVAVIAAGGSVAAARVLFDVRSGFTGAPRACVNLTAGQARELAATLLASAIRAEG